MKAHFLPAFLLLGAVSAAADDGEKIYRKLCASCHGAKGEGAKEHPEPLAGDRSLEKLTRYIEKNMPEDAPGTCKGEDAKQVAAYLYNAFYSFEARLRNNPPRIELSRLTVRQYRHSVVDLLGSFAEPGRPDGRHGLRGEYSPGGRRFRDESRVLDRLDPVVDVDFGGATPAEEINTDEFSMRWSGSIFAPDAGVYEIVVETPNGVKVWLNDMDRPLIDAFVRSGNLKAVREKIVLLGGRTYPLRIEAFKSKRDKTSSVALKWRPPQRETGLVPSANLLPVRFPPLLVVPTPFPPDDRSMGYERGTLVTREWDEAATSAALEVAASVLARQESLAGARPGASDRKERLREFGRRFAERAFRRPLTPEQQAFFVDRHFEGDLDLALQKTLLLVLKSPRFLYTETGAAAPDAYDRASRISFGLWDSLPDRELLEAAKAGRLDTPAGIAREIERMMPDPRTRAKVREFLHQWLQLDRLEDLTKDAKRFPEFNDAVEADLRTSLDLFLDDVTWGEASDFRQFLLADYVYLNGRLAKVYGGDLPAGSPFRKVSLGPTKHVGILTHPLLMAGFAYDATSSPIHRGLLVARSFLGRRFRPPPDAVTPLSPDLHPDLTTRERISLQTTPQACQSCHSMINPLGFALENFDAVGRFRTTEKGKAIDASGAIWTLGGEPVRFNGARELGEYLAQSEETHASFVEQLFHYMVKQPVLAHGLDRPEALKREFARGGYNIRKLVAQVVAASAAAAPFTKETKGKSP